MGNNVTGAKAPSNNTQTAASVPTATTPRVTPSKATATQPINPPKVTAIPPINPPNKKKEKGKIIKHRNIFLVYFYSLITLGIYAIYWMVSTKNEINSQGAKIPTGWLIIVPIANLFWAYKYSEGFSEKIKKDNNAPAWFLVSSMVWIVFPAIVQSKLNELAG